MRRSSIRQLAQGSGKIKRGPVVIFFNKRKPLVGQVLEDLKEMLRPAGFKCVMVDVLSVREQARPLEIFLKEKPILGIALGGDGTLLTAARYLARHEVALMGINLGGLGFLSTAEESDWREVVQEALAGRLAREKRLALEVTLRQGRRESRELIVNDCVIRCGPNPRMIELEVSSSRHGYLAHLRGDGLIAATPSGSTAYALAAGGPIVEPSVPAYLLLPLASHSLTQRPILFEANQTIKVMLGQYHGEPAQALVVLDGQTAFKFKEGDSVELRPSSKPVVLLRSRQHSYFRSLRGKLHWSQ